MAASIVQLGLLVVALAPAQAQQQAQPLQCPDTGSGNMPDLGYCEPDWYPIPHGNAWDPAIVPNEAIQTWGDIVPGQQQSTLCKWFPPEAGSAAGSRGTCKTDISWIISSANIRKSLFDSQMMNYILRFQLYGACYRSTQYSDNDKSQYCAAWWLDAATNRKINASHICYDIVQWVEDPWTKQQVQRKWGCAHNAPVNGFVNSETLDATSVAAPPSVNDTAPGANGTAPVAPPAPVAPAAAGSTVPVATTTVPDPGAVAAPAPAAGRRRLMQATSAATTDTATASDTVPVGPPVVPGATEQAAAANDATVVEEAPAAPVNATAQAPVNATAAEPAAPAGPAAATGSVGTLEEFMTGETPYNGEGLEFNDARNTWYNCHAYTTAGTPQRETCYKEAFGATFGRDADTLRRMLELIQQEGQVPGAGPRCSEHFEGNGAQQGNTPNQQWCEGATSDYIVSEILAKEGWIGTPAQPYNLQPSITPPPPPFPPPPPPPPAAPPPPPISLAGNSAGGQATFTSVQPETQSDAALGSFALAAASAAVAAAAAVLVL